MELIEAPQLEIEDLPLPFDWTENLTSKSIFIQNMDGIKDDHLLEDFVKRQIEKSDDIQEILTKPSLAQVSPNQRWVDIVGRKVGHPLVHLWKRIPVIILHF